MSTPAFPATRPVAELDRRFYAFALDRALGWGCAAIAAALAYQLLSDSRVLGAIVAGVVVLVLIGTAIAVVLGLRGTTPGMAATQLRVVREDGGTPIGVGPALLRQLVLGIAGLPTFGFGLGALAWTAVMDPSGRRRGWHDQRAHSVVLDLRPVVAEEPVAEEGPRHVVNLTAMRLVPAPAPAPVAAPPRSPRPPADPPPAAPPVAAPTPAAPTPAAPTPATPPVTPPATPPATPVSTPAPAPVAAPSGRHAAPAPTPPKQQLGYPLVPEPAPEPAPAATPPAAPRVGPAHSTAERTVMRGDRALARWRVTFDSGETFVVEGLALVGRRPEPRKGEPVRHVVPLRSEDMSLSKTHAQFQVAADGVLVVMDRGSTNGSILLRQGVPRELAAGKPATLVDGDRVRFGDREMTVSRES